MSKISFLPTGYKAPKAAGAYMKMQDGDNKFRILTAPILGWEDWTSDKKPVRYRMDERPVKPIDPKKPVKHFWAFVVWNYLEEKIQILQVTQATIRNTLEALCADSDWGSPFYYDIKVIKTGEGKDTEYTVTPLPHKPLAAHIKEAFHENPINLEGLFLGEDPFNTAGPYTQGCFDKDNELEVPEASKRGTELKGLLIKCPKEFQDHINSFLAKNKVTMDTLPEHLYDRLEKAIIKNYEENQPQSVAS